MKENTEDELSRFTSNKNGDGNLRTSHIFSNKDECTIHISRHWEVRIAPPTIEILPQTIQNT